MEDQLNNVDSIPLPSCQVCGRQDETLRAVSYPFIISVIFVTFWRAFSGLWCKRHRRRYLLLSSFISGSLGWLGIPYGIFSTPITLFKLARGGNVDPLLNFQMLNALAEHKLNSNDPHGAIRCYEESLRFQESPEAHQKLLRLYQQYRPGLQQDALAGLTPFISIPGLFVMVTIVGLIIGISDIIIGYLLYPLFGSTESIFVVILSWLPLVLMLFLGVLFICSLIEWALKQIRCMNKPLALALAFFASSFAFYSILEGRALISALPSLLTAYSFSMNDTLFGARAILSYGGILELINLVQIQEMFAIIYLLLFGGGLVYMLYVGMDAASDSTRWQTRLGNIQKSLAAQSDGPTTLAWMWLAGIVSAAILFDVFLSPGRFVNVARANQHLENAVYAMDAGDVDGALPELEQAISIWPDSVRGHVLLGLMYLGQENYALALREGETALGLDPGSVAANLLMAFVNTFRLESEMAIENFKVVAASEPDWAMPHAYLALFYYQHDQTELMQQEIELALANEEGDGQAGYLIGTYYFGLREYAEAEKHLLKATQLPTATSTEYFLLARLYGVQKKYDLARNAIDKAAGLNAEKVDVHLARADLLLFQEDLAGALTEITEALKSYPDNSDVHGNLSYIYFQQGRFNDAAKEAELALQANPYNTQAYVEQAFAYHAQGRLAQALAAARTGVDYSPKSDRAHYILGLCFMESGMKAEAIREFEQFLDLYWERAFVVQYKENAERYLAQLQK